MCEQQRFHAHARRRERGLAAGMAAAHNNDIKIIRENHGLIGAGLSGGAFYARPIRVSADVSRGTVSGMRVKLVIQTALAHQTVVDALFHDATILKHQDTIGLTHSGEPVRDDQGRAVFQER